MHQDRKIDRTSQDFSELKNVNLEKKACRKRLIKSSETKLLSASCMKTVVGNVLGGYSGGRVDDDPPLRAERDVSRER